MKHSFTLMDKRSRINRLVKECDAVCREIVILRDKKCQKPNCKSSNKTLQWCHVFSRSIWSVRWDLDNSHALHPGCHNFWAHKCPDEYYDAVKNKIGDKRWSELVLRKNCAFFKRSESNLQLMLENLKRQLNSAKLKKEVWEPVDNWLGNNVK